MTNYQTIFSFCLEHDYYTQNICRAIEIRVPSQSVSMLKRRGLIFKQTKENQWSIIGDCEGAGVDDDSDVLVLEMILVEPLFVCFTIWQDFRPTHAYHLSLPCNKTKEEATNVIKDSEHKRQSDSFCSIEINLSNEMFKRAENGNAEINTLIFRSPEVYWEYLFVSRSEKNNENLELKEISGKVVFSEMEKIEIEPFTLPVLQTITKSPIPMNERYKLDISLIEIINNNLQKKRVLIKHIPHPSLGRFVAEQTHTIRQICYY